MQRYYMIVLCLLGLILWGCAPEEIETGPTEEETREVLESAWLYHDYIADELIAGNEYEVDTFNEAHNWLQTADTTFLNGRYSEAHTYASKSLAVFQNIVADFSKVRYIPELEATLEELQTIVTNDPDNPLVEFLPQLEQMLANAREQQENPLERLLQIDQMREDLQQFRQLKKIINEGQRVEQEIGDVSFETGEYTLTDKGKMLLRGFAEEIINMKDDRHQEFAEKVVVVKIKVVGYTDDQGFRQGSPLAKRLLEEAQLDEPQEKEARNELLNQLLSDERAQTIANHLADLISETIEDNHFTQIEQESIGKGSAIPPSVEAPYPEDDSRRRISRVYSYVITQ